MTMPQVKLLTGDKIKILDLFIQNESVSQRL